ncbi:MAG: thiamine pyrophosphate-binding protein [Rhodospirillales bacterium]|nr:thiamine pyrophosphate-binding protein [Rhodospirillales bacterium]
MESGYTVGDLVAEFLIQCGVQTVFGIASVHNIPMLDGIGRRNAPRFVMARGELGGTHMADGYARAGQRLGVMFSSTGPGAANAVGGLIEARFASSPVLHITGQTATKFADREMGTVHDPVDQLGMLRSVCKAAYRIRSPHQALGILTGAAAEALSAPMGPVSVEVPIDIQRAPIPRPAGLDHLVLPVAAPPVAPDAAIAALVTKIAAARRPMLWLGAGARGAAAEIAALVARGFGVVNSFAGRGILPEDHPMSLGALHGMGLEAVQEFYRDVDLLLVVGARLRGQETGDFALKLPENLVQIDIDPMADGRTYANSLFVCGEAKATLAAVLARLDDTARAEPGFAAAFTAMRDAARASFIASLGAYGSFSAQLRAVMPRDAIWARDITQNHTTWGNRLFPLYHPSQNIYPVGAGIGQGLSLGIGAALGGGGRKTVVMTGDGGFFLNMGELWTIVQEQLDLVVLVMNDRGYGVIKRIQESTQHGRRFYADLQAPALEGVARIAGMPFFRVTQAEAFGETMARTLAITGPSMVEVDMHQVGEFPAYYPFNQRPA